MKQILFFLAFVLIFEYIEPLCKNIHSACLNKRYDDSDVENTMKYLQNRFVKTNPKREKCKKSYVIRNIKCMNQRSINAFTKAVRELNNPNNAYCQLVKNHPEKVKIKTPDPICTWDDFAKLHSRYWSITHKASEAAPWHLQLLVHVNTALLTIDENLTIPYWDIFSDFANFKKSIVFRDSYFGGGGDPKQNHILTRGPFAYFLLQNPIGHYFRREWNNNTGCSWDPPEYLTSSLQKSSSSYTELISLVFAGHFKQHLCIGGYNGDLSIPVAPNDPLFHLFHIFGFMFVLKWQLQDDQNLAPIGYNNGLKLNWETGNVTVPNIENDTLIYYNTPVKELFQFGYGDLCFVYDQIIEDYLSLKNAKIPEAVNRLKEALPQQVYSQYFPKFASGNFTPFDYHLPNVGNTCNSGSNYNKMPVAQRYTDTENGLRQWESFGPMYGVIDVRASIIPYEEAYFEFMSILNDKTNYSSPYANQVNDE